ncbi:hypothetical protein MHBO_001331 [Bonamia ostreae]|uniref:Uncharacterized protein n=1 Tax=Bonamia ostreae TaxID=126728 RepID=A0ABV2AIN1_9EUKA
MATEANPCKSKMCKIMLCKMFQLEDSLNFDFDNPAIKTPRDDNLNFRALETFDLKLEKTNSKKDKTEDEMIKKFVKREKDIFNVDEAQNFTKFLAKKWKSKIE